MLMERLKVTILAGGDSAEREISQKSAENLLENLSSERYLVTVTELPVDKNDTVWVRDLLMNKPDIVFSALHGGNGEDGSVQGLLQCLNIPYIGSGVLSSAVCMDKQISKELLRANHIQVVDHVFIERHEDISSYREQIEALGFPVVIKPNKGGSSIGVAVSDNIIETEDAIKNIFDTYNDDVLVEKFIDGREAAVFVIEGLGDLVVTPVLDINKMGNFFDYNDKYTTKNLLSEISSLPAFMQDMMKDIAKKTFKALKCNGYCCVDMIVRDEQIYVIEVNTLPGMTGRSLLPLAIKSMVSNQNLTFGDFLDKMIDYELVK
jgi:D-alanine-D-alanine ligase